MIVAFNLDTLHGTLRSNKVKALEQERIFRFLKETLIGEQHFEGASTLRELQTAAARAKQSEAAAKANRTRKRAKAKGAGK